MGRIGQTIIIGGAVIFMAFAVIHSLSVDEEITCVLTEHGVLLQHRESLASEGLSVVIPYEQIVSAEVWNSLPRLEREEGRSTINSMLGRFRAGSHGEMYLVVNRREESHVYLRTRDRQQFLFTPTCSEASDFFRRLNDRMQRR